MISRERVTFLPNFAAIWKSIWNQNLYPKAKVVEQISFPSQGVNYQLVSMGSYRIERILSRIKQLPNRFNMFTGKGFAIYVLDDYSIHVMPEFRQTLFKKGYILVITAGGINGDIQINDTRCHHHQKSHYRDFEMKTKLEQLKKDPNKTLSTSWNGKMYMLLQS